ncbi:MAG: hypothetical protein M0C28_45365 [Candidatus Moduliflexus flocculans]|nr:hypothetical protein [Candidatus Moduliflexus flocculans]
MASQYKYKNDEELLQLIPDAPGGKLFSDEEEVFAAADARPRRAPGSASPRTAAAGRA